MGRKSFKGEKADLRLSGLHGRVLGNLIRDAGGQGQGGQAEKVLRTDLEVLHFRWLFSGHTLSYCGEPSGLSL